MFSTVNHFQMLNQAVLMADKGHYKFRQENQSKASEEHHTLLNGVDWKWQKRHCPHKKHAMYRQHASYSQSHLQKIFRFNPLCNH